LESFLDVATDVRGEPKIKAYEKTMEQMQLKIKGFSPFCGNKNRAQILIDWTSGNIKTVLDDVNENLIEKYVRAGYSGV